MLNTQSRIVITGYAAASVPSDPTQSLPDWYSDVAPLPRKYQRFGGRCAAEAISVYRDALSMANTDPHNVGARFGIYTCQAGYQHPEFDDYEQAFYQLSSPEHLIDELWHSKVINPFLAIKALSNNLLGLISIMGLIRGDCAALIRDEAGISAALNEALFQLNTGVIDTALVIVSGTQYDQHNAAVYGKQPVMANTGAAALVLQRIQTPNGGNQVCIERVEHYFDPSSRDASTTAIADARWGGIVLDIAHSIHNSNTNQPTTLRRHDTYGNHTNVILTRS